MPHYLDIGAGIKTAEIRKNDRDYKAGDYLVMRPVSSNGEYASDGDITAEVLHVLTDFPEGLQEGYCLLSLRVVRSQVELKLIRAYKQGVKDDAD